MYESGENYLETILVLSKRQGSVRSIDIARELEYSKPSVSRAIGILKANGLISVDRDGIISLTNIGKSKADNIYERHRLLTEFLVKTAGVRLKIAEIDACRIEHVVSEETIIGIKEYLQQY